MLRYHLGQSLVMAWRFHRWFCPWRALDHDTSSWVSLVQQCPWMEFYSRNGSDGPFKVVYSMFYAYKYTKIANYNLQPSENTQGLIFLKISIHSSLLLLSLLLFPATCILFLSWRKTLTFVDKKNFLNEFSFEKTRDFNLNYSILKRYFFKNCRKISNLSYPSMEILSWN